MRSWVADACIRSLKQNAERLDKKLSGAGLAATFLTGEVLVAASGFIAIMVANAVTASEGVIKLPGS